MGRDEAAAAGSLRVSLGHTSSAADVDAFVDAIAAVVERARAAGVTVRGGADRARPGGDVRRSRLRGGGGARRRRRARRHRGAPGPVADPAGAAVGQSRLLLTRGLGRRPAGRRRARCAFLRLGRERAVPGRRGGRLRRRVRRRPHPEPLRALQRADQVRRRARPRAGAGVRRRGDRPLRPPGRRASRSRAAPRRRRRQGPVVRAGGAAPRPARARALPAGRHGEGRRTRGGGRPRSCRRGQARQPRHLLRGRRRHPRLPAPRARRAPRPARRRVGCDRSASTRARTASRSASAVGCGSACRRPTGSRATCSTSSRSRARSRWGRARRWQWTWSRRPGRGGARVRRRAAFDARVQLRAHGEQVPAWVEIDDDRLTARLSRPAHGVADGQTLVVYDGTRVVGSATVGSPARLVAASTPRPGVG